MKHRHLAELDGIRGIAILAVLISHATPAIALQSSSSKLARAILTPGWAGVELFFVLSGFLITGILLRTKEAKNYFYSFYARRFLRIFPIYYLTLTAVLLLAGHYEWLKPAIPDSFPYRFSYYVYLQNWPVFWVPTFLMHNALGHFWSLAVEEQFYLLWPILVWKLPRRALFWLCIGGCVLALPLRIYFVSRYGTDFSVMHLTTSRMDGLLIGSLIGMVQFHRTIPMRAIAGCFAGGFALIAFIVVRHPYELLGTAQYMHTIGVTGFALLSGAFVAFSQHHITPVQKLLTPQWLRTVGKYSYGMYVYHLPLFVLIDSVVMPRLGFPVPMSLRYALPYTAVLIGLTFLVAKVSFDVLESPILNWKKHFEPKFAKPKQAVAVAGD